MPRRARLILLGVLFVITTALLFSFAWSTIRFVADTPNLPVTTFPMGDDLRFTEEGMGARKGDQLLALDGVAVGSKGQAARQMIRKKIGEPLVMRFARGGVPFEVTGKVEKQSDYPSWYIGLAILTLNVFTPLFGAFLGFFVAFRRPMDRLAWEMLLVLYGLSHSATANGYLLYSDPLWLTIPALFLSPSGFFLLSAGCLWFGLDFPDPSSPKRLGEWLRWPLTAVLAFVAVVACLDSVRSVEFPFAMGWVRSTERAIPSWLVGWCISLSLTLGFANLAYKAKIEIRSDLRRRLHLLLTGLAVGLGPSIVLQVYAWIRGVSIGSLPFAIVMPVLMALFLVPLAMSYVLIVHKAMDVRVAVRQGLRYAFLRRSADLLRIALAAGIVWMLVGVSRGPSQRQWVVMVPAILGSAGIILFGHPRLRTWIDRSFFRESIDAERVLRDLSEQVRTIVEPAELVATVTSRIGSALHASQVTAFLKDGERFVCDGFHPIAATSKTVARLAMGPARVYFDRPDEWLRTLPAVESELLRSVGAELLLPMRARQETLGFLSLGAKKSEEPYSRSDIRLLETVAVQTALALDNARLTTAVAEQAAQRERLQQEIEIAREVQLRLLPKRKPEIPGLDYAGHCRPAQMIGGDYFDYLETPSGAFAFAIGDIAGKGIPAALLMSNLQAALRGLNLAGITDLRDLLAKLNQLVYDATPSNRFATFFYCLYEPGSRRMVYSSAGHNPAALLRRDATEVEWLRTRGIGLGLQRKTAFEQREFLLEPGDVLLLYTDGLTEAVNAARDEYSEERLGQELAVHRDKSAGEIVERLLWAVDRFVGDAPQHDDMTLMVVRAIG